MVTFEQALTANFFHYGDCKKITGPRGGVTTKVETWRRNGKTQTWKTRPGEFRVPIKYGLKTCGYLTHANAQFFHLASGCTIDL